MNRFEQLKIQYAKELEESKKIKLSLTSEEHAHMLYLLEKEDKEYELAKLTPAVPKPTKPPEEAIVRKLKTNDIKLGRFGR